MKAQFIFLLLTSQMGLSRGHYRNPLFAEDFHIPTSATLRERTLRQEVDPIRRAEEWLEKNAHGVQFRWKKSSHLVSSAQPYLRGIPLCHGEVRFSDRESTLFGNVECAKDWEEEIPDVNLSLQVAQSHWGNGESALISKELCVLADARVFRNVWRIHLKSSEITASILVNENRVFQIVPLHFSGHHVALRVYEKNPRHGVLTTRMTEVTEKDRLKTQFLETHVEDERYAREEDGQYFYDPDEPEFSEVSVLSNAYESHKYFQSKGYHWTSPSPLELVIHPNSDLLQGIALWTFPSAHADNRPRLYIGADDSSSLINLSLDQDVVMHEFSHQVIYDSGPQASYGKTVALHEGLADAWTYLRTGDACLAESVCTSVSDFCVKPLECLRVGTDPSVWNEKSLDAPHLQGQIISSLIWSLAEQYSRPLVESVLYQTQLILPREAGPLDFGVAFSQTAQRVAPQAACGFSKAIIARGLAEDLGKCQTGRVTEKESRQTEPLCAGGFPSGFLWLLSLLSFFRTSRGAKKRNSNV